MNNQTSKRTAEIGAAEHGRVALADVRHQPMFNDSQNPVFAIGELPWLDDPVAAVRAMARRTRLGNFMFAAANESCLDRIKSSTRTLLYPVYLFCA